MPLIPERFTGRHSRVVAYYAGPEAVPVGSSITRHHPALLTSDQRKHVNDLVDACQVWLGMQPNSEELKKKHRSIAKVPVLDCVDVSFAALIPNHRISIAMHDGFNTIIKEEHPWLTFSMSAEEDHYYNPPKEEDDDD